jgi:antiviral helicase SLH1
MQKNNGSWAMFVTPQQSAANEIHADFRPLCSVMNVPLELISSPKSLLRPRNKLIRIISAGNLLATLASLGLQKSIPGLSLVICDDLEQLNPTYEWALSLLRHATQFQPTRYIGLSNSLGDPADLADWLNVHPTALLSFQPRDRDQSLQFNIQTFTITHSPSLYKAMAKPAHSAIRTVPQGENAIIFVPSQGACRSIALSLLTQCMLEMESSRGYLPDRIPDEYIEDVCARLNDTSLVDFISKGIGFFHGGVNKHDRLLMLGLFVEGAMRVLVVPHDSALSLPVRAAVVVVMGTQYFGLPGPSSDSSDRQLQDYSLAKIVRMQSRAVRHSETGHFFLFCQVEAKDTLTRFLNDGLPLESELLDSPLLMEWMKAQNLDWRRQKQDLMDVLSFSFLSRRMVTNPSYYDCSSKGKNENLSRIVDRLLEKALQPEVQLGG